MIERASPRNLPAGLQLRQAAAPCYRPAADSCQKYPRETLCGAGTERHASGRQALAATRSARSNDPATTLGGHARSETVAPFADKFGWLIGTLHLFDYRGVRPFLVLPGFVLLGGTGTGRPICATTKAPGGRPERAAAYRKRPTGSQPRGTVAREGTGRASRKGEGRRSGPQMRVRDRQTACR